MTREPDVDDLSLERRAFDDEREGFTLLRAASLLPRVVGRMPEAARVEDAVDEWARLVLRRMATGSSGSAPRTPLEAIVQVMFLEGGLRGDLVDTDHPDNSFLDAVVDRRRGLPIALSVLVLAVCERAGVRAWGLALPASFCVAVFLDDERFTVIDPFAGGTLLPPAAVAERAGVPESELGEVLQPATSSQILTRMLVNLVVSFNRRAMHEPLSRALDRLLMLRPNDPRLLVERAAVRRLLLDDEGALADAEAACAAAPDDERIARAAAAVRAELERAHILN